MNDNNSDHTHDDMIAADSKEDNLPFNAYVRQVPEIGFSVSTGVNNNDDTTFVVLRIEHATGSDVHILTLDFAEKLGAGVLHEVMQAKIRLGLVKTEEDDK